MFVWNAISSIVLMIFETWRLESWMPAIAATMSCSAWFDSLARVSTSFRCPTTSVVASAFLRVISASSSTDADVSSSDAACSVALCERLCDEPDICPAAAITISAPADSLPAATFSVAYTVWTM